MQIFILYFKTLSFYYLNDKSFKLKKNSANFKYFNFNEMLTFVVRVGDIYHVIIEIKGMLYKH